MPFAAICPYSSMMTASAKLFFPVWNGAFFCRARFEAARTAASGAPHQIELPPRDSRCGRRRQQLHRWRCSGDGQYPQGPRLLSVASSGRRTSTSPTWRASGHRRGCARSLMTRSLLSPNSSWTICGATKSIMCWWHGELRALQEAARSLRFRPGQATRMCRETHSRVWPCLHAFFFALPTFPPAPTSEV